MTTESTEFEKLIAEIENLLSKGKADVKWNQSIKDPDSPNQTRQIDILIKENDRTTHVECRIHKHPQDVKWIEELMGRRASLQVDAIVGVSSSGFTKPALTKARNHGIILRDLLAISKKEIDSWGKVFKASVEYMYFESIVFELYTKDETGAVSANAKDLHDFLHENSSTMQFLLGPLNDVVRKRAETQQKNNRAEHGNFKIQYDLILYTPSVFKEKLIHRINVIIPSLKSQFVDYFVSQVALYGKPGEHTDDRTTSIQKMEETGWQLIDTPSKGKFSLDTMILQPPPNSILSGIKLSNLPPFKNYETEIKYPQIEDYYDKMENITVKIIQE